MVFCIEVENEEAVSTELSNSGRMTVLDVQSLAAVTPENVETESPAEAAERALIILAASLLRST